MNKITDVQVVHQNKVFTLASPEDWRLSVEVWVEPSGITHSTVMIDGKFCLYEDKSWITVVESEWDETNVKLVADQTMSRFAERLRAVLQP